MIKVKRECGYITLQKKEMGNVYFYQVLQSSISKQTIRNPLISINTTPKLKCFMNKQEGNAK